MDLKRDHYLKETGLKPVSRIARGGRERKNRKNTEIITKMKMSFVSGFNDSEGHSRLTSFCCLIKLYSGNLKSKPICLVLEWSKPGRSLNDMIAYSIH